MFDDLARNGVISLNSTSSPVDNNKIAKNLADLLEPLLVSIRSSHEAFEDAVAKGVWAGLKPMILQTLHSSLLEDPIRLFLTQVPNQTSQFPTTDPDHYSPNNTNYCSLPQPLTMINYKRNLAQAFGPSTKESIQHKIQRQETTAGDVTQS
jgi:hypothetical protein